LAADTFASLPVPAAGITGSIGVGAVRSCATGCITIGRSGFLLAMTVNACQSISFEAPEGITSAVANVRGQAKKQ
jgi:hypothetical protein